MMDPCTKRAFLQGGAAAVAASLSGCLFGWSQGRASTGYIQFFNEGDRDWTEEGQTIRVEGQKGGTKAFERSVQIPYSGDALTVPPDSYSIYVYVDDELIGKFEWDATGCQNSVIIYFEETKKEGIIHDTSAC